jgi:hypothetical protein
MLCPAISDPFYGKYYRMAAVCHQGVMLMIHGKIYTLLCCIVLPLRKNIFPPNDKTVEITGNKPELIKEEKAWNLMCNWISPPTENTMPSPQNNHNATVKHGTSNNISEKNGHAKIH